MCLKFKHKMETFMAPHKEEEKDMQKNVIDTTFSPSLLSLLSFHHTFFVI